MQVPVCFTSGQRRGLRNQRRKTSLPPGFARLLEMMRDLHFGRIEHLFFRNGDVVFDPPPRVVREIKFGGEHGPRPVPPPRRTTHGLPDES